MKFFRKRIFWLLVPILVLEGSNGGPTKTPVRNGKFMAFTAHDMFSDLLDDVQDPLPIGAIDGKDKSNRINDSIKTTTVRPSKISDTKMTKLPVKTEEKIALYNQDTGKFELITTTSGHFSFPLRPVTEKGVFFYGGQHYQYRQPIPQPPGGNRTEEIKIFWSSVGDAIENSPYFPIQINVPDMITAMTNFLVNYIPFINRLTNPNQPRLPYPIPARNHTEMPIEYYEHYDVYQPPDNSLSRREFKNAVKLEEKSSKLKRKTKRKSNKRKSSGKSSSKRIFQRPMLRKTTSPPTEDLKLWHQFGSDQKETFRLKNMPITRKRVRVADREIFNFKNSDISNSPIMILNVPQRPITHYKVTHQEIREKEPTPAQTKPKPEPPTASQTPAQTIFTSLPAPAGKSQKIVKQRRKLKNEVKSKKNSKRTGRSESEMTEQPTSSKPTTQV